MSVFAPIPHRVAVSGGAFPLEECAKRNMRRNSEERIWRQIARFTIMPHLNRARRSCAETLQGKKIICGTTFYAIILSASADKSNLPVTSLISIAAAQSSSLRLTAPSTTQKTAFSAMNPEQLISKALVLAFFALRTTRLIIALKACANRSMQYSVYCKSCLL